MDRQQRGRMDPSGWRFQARPGAYSPAGRTPALERDSFKLKLSRSKQQGYEFTSIYATVDNRDLNIARVSDRVRKGGHPVPADRIMQRRTRSHTMFEWFAREADMVLVFDNSDNALTLCAMKAADRWHLRHLSRLPADLTDTIQRLTGHRAD